MKKMNQWYQATEKMLYTFKSFPIRVMALMQQIEVVREQLLPGMVPFNELREGTNYSISSPVENAVINSIESNKIQEIERKINNLETLKEIVEISIDMLDHEQQQLVDMIYCRNMTWQQICMDLAIDKNTFYARKNDIIKVLAWCFGYLPEEEAEKVLGIFIDQALWQKTKVG